MGTKFDFLYKNPLYWRAEIHPSPTLEGSIPFDFRTERLLYGRIDRESVPVTLETMNLGQIKHADSTILAVDFVAKAFDAMAIYIKKAAGRGGVLARESILYNIRAKKGFVSPQTSYHEHMLYLVNSFISMHIYDKGLAKNVLNFKHFAREFIKFAAWQTRKLPITKSSYMASSLCDPASSGLTVELEAPPSHISYNKIKKYFDDPNFGFYRNAAKLHGFRVDMWAPWRLVCNISSKTQAPIINALGEDTGLYEFVGTRKYMQQYGITDSNIFDIYYIKTYTEDIDLLQRYLYSGYKIFADLEPYANVDEIVRSKVGGCYEWKEIIIKVEREVFELDQNDVFKENMPDSFAASYGDEFWLNMYFRLKLMESGDKMLQENINRELVSVIRTYRSKGMLSAQEQISNKFKGFEVNKLKSVGRFWQGQSDKMTSRNMNHAHIYYIDAEGNGVALEACNPDLAGVCHMHEIINYIVQPATSKTIDPINGTPLHIHQIPIVEGQAPVASVAENQTEEQLDDTLKWYEQEDVEGTQVYQSNLVELLGGSSYGTVVTEGSEGSSGDY
jgi:hypothetical protein